MNVFCTAESVQESFTTSCVVFSALCFYKCTDIYWWCNCQTHIVKHLSEMVRIIKWEGKHFYFHMRRWIWDYIISHIVLMIFRLWYLCGAMVTDSINFPPYSYWIKQAAKKICWFKTAHITNKFSESGSKEVSSSIYFCVFNLNPT